MSGRRRISLIERFDEKHAVDPASGCWLWNASKNKAGYGQFAFGVRPWLAHRVSWLLSKGEIPDGMHVLHRCDTPACVNPDHLFLGTDLDNVRDMYSKGRNWTGKRLVGAEHGMAKLTEELVLAIFCEAGTELEISKKFSVCKSTVNHIKSGRQWSTVTGMPKKEMRLVDHHNHHPNQAPKTGQFGPS